MSCLPQNLNLNIQNLESKDPINLFSSWLKLAKSCKNIQQAETMCLSTSTKNGKPSCRMIVIADFNHNGFLFFTNYKSKKSLELESNPEACMCFYWEPLNRQVVVSGKVKKISQEESIKYFSMRPFESQIKTLVSSEQDKVIQSKEVLIEKQKNLIKQYESTHKLPSPENWGGFLFVPEEFEFYQVNLKDIDDRIRFRKSMKQEDESMITRGEKDWVIETLIA